MGRKENNLIFWRTNITLQKNKNTKCKHPLCNANEIKGSENVLKDVRVY